MTDYNELVDAIAQVIENNEQAVPLVFDADVYAAYAWNYHYTAEDLEDFYSDAEDAYQGDYTSDEAFAEDMADGLGFTQSDEWPARHINWTAAADELMQDYWSKEGLYFRSF